MFLLITQLNTLRHTSQSSLLESNLVSCIRTPHRNIEVAFFSDVYSWQSRAGRFCVISVARRLRVQLPFSCFSRVVAGSAESACSVSMTLQIVDDCSPANFFRDTTFWPLGGTASSNFYMRYRLTKACSRTPEGGPGSPQRKN